MREAVFLIIVFSLKGIMNLRTEKIPRSFFLQEFCKNGSVLCI